MPVGAHVGIDIEIVIKHKLASQLIVVRSGILLEQAQRRVTLALPEAAEHLIVGTILFHDI